MTALHRPSDHSESSQARRRRTNRASRSGTTGLAREPLAAAGALAVVVTCCQIGAHQRVQQPSRVTNVAAAGARSHSEVVANPVDQDAGAQRQVPPAAPVEASSGSATSVGVLSKWQEGVAQLAAGKRAESLRVLWFGDSHTAADYFPNAVRKQLAARVPSGGPGYIGLGIPGFRHGMAKAWSEGNLELSPHPPARRNREDDGVFGLGGTRVSLRDPTASVTAKAMIAAPTAMQYELTYRLPAEPDALRVTAGERRYELTSSAVAPTNGGLRHLRFEARSDTTVEIRALRGRPQVFGIVMETQQPGLVIDTLGVNGARFGTLLAWDEPTWAQLVAQRQPALVIVAYGTNEVFDPEPIERHARRLDEVVQRLRRSAVDAACLVVGPTDAGKGGEATRARVVALDAAERSTAERLGCAYFSPFELMASEGGFDGWARQEPPLALTDGIHLSARGYARLGEALAPLLQPGR